VASVVREGVTDRTPTTVIGDRLLLHNALVGGSSLLAGLLGFAFQSLVSHRFQPADYASVFGAMTLLTLITLPAAALTLLMARQTSRDLATGHAVASRALLREGNRALLALGVVLGLTLAVVSPWVGSFLNAGPGFVVAVAASLPVGFALPLLLGELQGEQRFLPFSLLTGGQAALKLIAAIVLGTVLGPIGVVAGLAAASTVIYLFTWSLLRTKMRSRVAAPWLRPALRYLVLVVPSTLALSVLLSTDVLLANHFFSKSTAGEYGAVAALGRAIFWGASAVATVLFPKVIFREVSGGSGARLVGLSLGLVVLASIGGLLLLVVSSGFVLSAFAGSAYLGGAKYLAGYGVAMALFGCAAVLIATHQSRARGTFLAVLIPIAAAEPLAIIAFHRDPIQLVEVLIVTMATLVVGLGALLIRDSQAALQRLSGVGALTQPAEVKA
jgi:O-antigen/teichoic acid export membrane protein